MVVSSKTNDWSKIVPVVGYWLGTPALDIVFLIVCLHLVLNVFPPRILMISKSIDTVWQKGFCALPILLCPYAVFWCYFHLLVRGKTQRINKKSRDIYLLAKLGTNSLVRYFVTVSNDR